jgi:hypothetical protein
MGRRGRGLKQMGRLLMRRGGLKLTRGSIMGREEFGWRSVMEEGGTKRHQTADHEEEQRGD